MANPNRPKGHFENGVYITEQGREVTMADWLGEAPEYERFDETITCDVAVVGGGVAGVAAARAAVEAGAETVLLEKCDALQCRSGDFTAIGSKVAEEHWPVGDERFREKLLLEFMRDSAYSPAFRIMKRWLDECGDAFDWYLDGDPDLYYLPTPTTTRPKEHPNVLYRKRYPLPEAVDYDKEYFTTYPVTMTLSPSQHSVFQGNWALADKTGKLRTLLGTPGKRLLTDETGRVTGVIAEDYDGRVTRVEARRGVVLATGDYAGNPDILYYYMPRMRHSPVVYTSADRNHVFANQGDGHKMAMWVGGKMEEEPHATMNHNLGGAIGPAAYLLLNENGERFMNEDVTGQQVDNQLLRQPGLRAFQIFDADWVNQVPVMASGQGTIYGLVDEAEHPGERFGARGSYAFTDEVERGVRQGTVMKGETLEALVSQLGISEAAQKTALRSIARYNELAAKGHDDDFFKHPRRLFPIQKAPFYACRFEPAAIIAAMGGIESDQEARVLDEQRHVIPGLYAAGNVQGNRFTGEYPMTIPGLSHSMALTYGRIAGTNAAKGV